MRFKNCVIICFFFLSVIGCENVKVDKSSLPGSSGKYGEVLVVVDTIYENGSTGEELENIFFKAMVGMPQQEQQFRMSSVPPSAFKSILKRSRNILKLNIGKGKKTNINIERDVWAKDQLLISITADSDEAGARILNKNVETIRNYYNEEELSRLKSQYLKMPEKALMKDISAKFNLEIIIPPGYAKMDGNQDGIWLKKEKTIGEHQVMQGLSIYSFPYSNDSAFHVSKMIKSRNDFTKEFIQGTRDNSFMHVYDEYKPVETELNLNGLYSVEYRGLWNMKNDFMGGPFLHYTFIDEINNRVINLDGFVFAPKFNKREYLRELEAIMKTVELNLN